MALTGCSAGPLIDKLPPEMGLPKDTPGRPETPYQYPAVHDMPPPRATEPMSEDDQVKLENDLKTVRDRQPGRPPASKKATADAAKKAADEAAKKASPGEKKAKKPKPASGGATEAAGVKPNP